ncbi:MAG: glucose-6-phosphate isomerase [Bacteroidales bacterium]|nr:glucose-6-phosphate isomerase [Bacteroidales bacterium]
MKTMKVSIDNIQSFVSKDEISKFQSEINQHHQSIIDRTGQGKDFLGWFTLPSEITEAHLTDIEQTALSIRSKVNYLVVIGIGGSYLGAKAVVEALKNSFSDFQQSNETKILYAGQNLSEDYLSELLTFLDDKKYAICVISKSGTTTEPAVAFRLLKNHLESKVGKEAAKKLIIAITDKERGALKILAEQENYKTYEVPDDVGGRYSVLTPVGLLPIAVAGFDIRALVQGARDMKDYCLNDTSMDRNPAALYAASRNALLQKGFDIEMLINFSPKLMYFTEWWKQLYGESEGKEQKGIFPAGANFTTDLHSMGQYIQEGRRVIFETLISVEKAQSSILVPEDEQNLDGLNYLAGKHIEYVNEMAEKGTTLAHLDGGVPNIKISIEQIDEYNLGQLIYFFELACAYSGYILGVNPFDQPGVEAYKKNMFALLRKPGHEADSAEIYKRF